MATSNILPFCPTDIATNLLSNPDYLAASDRVSGNKPGVASARLNNKALRQSTAIAAAMSTLAAALQATDITDDTAQATLVAAFRAAFVGSQSLLPSGWRKFPDGMILQWGGVIIPTSTGTNWVFPIAFPTNALNVQATLSTGSAEIIYMTGFNNTFAVVDSNPGATLISAQMFAIGY